MPDHGSISKIKPGPPRTTGARRPRGACLLPFGFKSFSHRLLPHHADRDDRQVRIAPAGPIRHRDMNARPIHRADGISSGNSMPAHASPRVQCPVVRRGGG
jgi:hypothetical protein